MIKPIYPLLDVFDLSLLLLQWRKRGLTEIRTTKLLRLLLGREFIHYMDEQQRYTFSHFNELRLLLKYRSCKEMIDDVELSGAFVILIDKNSYVTHFYSPLWHDWVPSDGPVKKGSFQKRAVHSWDNYALSSLAESAKMHLSRNILIVNEVIKKEEINKEKKNKVPIRTNLDEVLPENLQIVTNFFHFLNQDDALRREFFIVLIDEFYDKGFTRNQAKRMMIAMMEDYVQPYLARKREFLEENNYARITRLRNIYEKCKYTWFRHIKGASINKILEEDRLNAETQRKEEESTHIYSGFEWVTKNGLRIYNDPDEGKIVIPQDAPPRPSSDAYYDFYTKTWIQ